MKKLGILLIAFMLLILAACGETQEKPATSGEDTAKEESYTVTHAMGETTIKAEPKRIVVLTNEGVEAVLAMGVTPVGAVEAFTGDTWYKHTADQLKDTKTVGNESEPSLEAIAALKPDLIIGNKMRQEKIYDQLSKIAPTVFAETLRGDWQENFSLYSKAINKEDVGLEKLDAYNNRIEDLKVTLGDQTKQKVSMVRFMAGDVRIYHKDSFSGVILEQLGFARPAEQDLPDFAEKGVTKERIPAMDGDIMFYFTYETGDKEATKLEDEWINDPLFQNLEVSKAKKVFKVDDVIWNTAGGYLAADLMLDDLETHFK
ncbi:ABC transporter substrate-binding protein [Paenisporosarcina antarctica]|uniref:Iron-siderophore ABC transporter substrate-binding protein n=1 Tax=Paenisporosarcina antarctica TaxID=417367 RepID=A0A4P6ZUL0_9BACL|nr:iron-siderophore ABC transporter substrate-binding protein [Paenisporosarcina antarctica]QBP39917.1 iron-siderophore ABC transporter substrate-binding protein [Paenisporosarcina antarctica]